MKIAEEYVLEMPHNNVQKPCKCRPIYQPDKNYFLLELTGHDIVSRRVVPSNKDLFVVTIGASAGGLNAIYEIVSQLSPEINAAIFIVIHLSRAAIGDILVNRMQKSSSLPCEIAEHDKIFRAGYIYVAPPDAHLLVKDDHMVIGRGPEENRFRPSIDVLFRSAAASHGEKSIGIILTGFLNDGTAGMMAIKQSGGHCIVQDPNEAEYPDMPLSVLETMGVDYCIPLKK